MGRERRSGKRHRRGRECLILFHFRAELVAHLERCHRCRGPAAGKPTTGPPGAPCDLAGRALLDNDGGDKQAGLRHPPSVRPRPPSAPATRRAHVMGWHCEMRANGTRRARSSDLASATEITEANEIPMRRPGSAAGHRPRDRQNAPPSRTGVVEPSPTGRAGSRPRAA